MKPEKETPEALEKAWHVQHNSKLKIIASKTVVENGRIVTKHLVSFPELGRGKARWI